MAEAPYGGVEGVDVERLAQVSGGPQGSRLLADVAVAREHHHGGVREIGIGAITERNRRLTEHLVGAADRAGLELALPQPGRRSAIVMIRHDDPASAVARLAAEGVIVDHRPGFVRVSPHFYNTVEELDLCVEVLAATQR